MQYSHATVDLIVMAVDQKDRKSLQPIYPEAYNFINTLCPPFDTLVGTTIDNYGSKLHLSIKHMNIMHNRQQFLCLNVWYNARYIRTSTMHSYVQNTCPCKKIITPYLPLKIINPLCIQESHFMSCSLTKI